MILVTLGTQDKKFPRLLEQIEDEIIKGNIKDKVIVQSGCTPFESDYMEIFDYLPMDEFNELIKECDLLITHGGVGSIISGLKYQKCVIAVPRLKKYKEHVNDHQLQIIDNFKDYIIGIHDVSDLSESLKKVKNFKPKKYQSNTKNMVKLISELIDND